jgi:hypothetical protein
MEKLQMRPTRVEPPRFARGPMTSELKKVRL